MSLCRHEDKKPMESETNSVDRAIANLMFNKMDINVQDLPMDIDVQDLPNTTSVCSKQEPTETKTLQRKTSKASSQARNFHHPYTLNPRVDSEVPRFNQSDQQTASESHVMYRDPTKKSFVLEFG